MTRDARLFRGALTASMAVHLAAAAIPGLWMTTLIAVDDVDPAPGRPVEVSLWTGSEGGGTPSPASAAPATASSVIAPPPNPAPASDSPENAAPTEPIPSANGTPAESGAPGGIGLGIPGWRRPGGGGGGSGAEGGGTNLYVPPRLLAGALPIDPADSEALHVPKEIPVRLRVGIDGHVREVVPEIDDLPPAVLAALRRSAEAMRFTPARRAGEPVEAWFPMTFVYRR